MPSLILTHNLYSFMPWYSRYGFTHFIVCVYYIYTVGKEFASFMTVHPLQILRFIYYFKEEELESNEGLRLDPCGYLVNIKK